MNTSVFLQGSKANYTNANRSIMEFYNIPWRMLLNEVWDKYAFFKFKLKAITNVPMDNSSNAYTNLADADKYFKFVMRYAPYFHGQLQNATLFREAQLLTYYGIGTQDFDECIHKRYDDTAFVLNKENISNLRFEIRDYNDNTIEPNTQLDGDGGVTMQSVIDKSFAYYETADTPNLMVDSINAYNGDNRESIVFANVTKPSLHFTQSAGNSSNTQRVDLNDWITEFQGNVVDANDRSFSVSFWFSTNGNADMTIYHLMHDENDDGFRIYMTSSGNIGMHFKSNNGANNDVFQTTQTYNDNTFRHCLLQIGEFSRSIYINGVSVEHDGAYTTYFNTLQNCSHNYIGARRNWGEQDVEATALLSYSDGTLTNNASLSSDVITLSTSPTINQYVDFSGDKVALSQLNDFSIAFHFTTSYNTDVQTILYMGNETIEAQENHMRLSVNTNGSLTFRLQAQNSTYVHEFTTASTGWNDDVEHFGVLSFGTGGHFLSIDGTTEQSDTVINTCLVELDALTNVYVGIRNEYDAGVAGASTVESNATHVYNYVGGFDQDNSGNNYDLTYTSKSRAIVQATVGGRDCWDCTALSRTDTTNNSFFNMDAHVSSLLITDISFVFWIRGSYSGVVGNASNQFIIHVKDSATGGGSDRLVIYSECLSASNSKIRIVGADVSTETQFRNATVNIYDGSWHHVVVQISSTVKKLWVDGAENIEFLTGDASNDFCMHCDLSSNDLVGIFNRRNSGSDGGVVPFRNYMSNLTIYDSILTSSQISALYNETVTVAGGTSLAHPYIGTLRELHMYDKELTERERTILENEQKRITEGYSGYLSQISFYKDRLLGEDAVALYNETQDSGTDLALAKYPYFNFQFEVQGISEATL